MANTLSPDLLETYVPRARQYLATAARQHRLVPYMQIANDLGGRGYVGQVLDELNRREHDQGRPLISAIVVDAETEQPSEGFFKLAIDVGLTLPSSDRRAFWEAERDRVWAFDWTR
jgi:hypothetical protein